MSTLARSNWHLWQVLVVLAEMAGGCIHPRRSVLIDETARLGDRGCRPQSQVGGSGQAALTTKERILIEEALAEVTRRISPPPTTLIKLRIVMPGERSDQANAAGHNIKLPIDFARSLLDLPEVSDDLRSAMFAFVIAHELGHRSSVCPDPEHQDCERVADAFAERFGTGSLVLDAVRRALTSSLESEGRAHVTGPAARSNVCVRAAAAKVRAAVMLIARSRDEDKGDNESERRWKYQDALRAQSDAEEGADTLLSCLREAKQTPMDTASLKSLIEQAEPLADSLVSLRNTQVPPLGDPAYWSRTTRFLNNAPARLLMQSGYMVARMNNGDWPTGPSAEARFSWGDGSADAGLAVLAARLETDNPARQLTIVDAALVAGILWGREHFGLTSQIGLGASHHRGYLAADTSLLMIADGGLEVVLFRGVHLTTRLGIQWSPFAENASATGTLGLVLYFWRRAR